MKSRPLSPALAAVAVLSLGVSLAACSGDSGSATTTLEFQTAQSADSPLYAALEKVTAEFEKAHPDISVDLKTGANDYESQIKVRLAANDPPDLWATHGWSLLRYSQFLAPLQDEAWAEDFNPALDPAMRNSDGEFFALPINTEASGLIVNEDVLAAAGVDPAGITDWDSFQAAGDAVVADGGVALTLAGSKDGSAGNVIDWLAPGAFTEDELESFADGDFQGPAYEELLDVLAGMQEAGWVNPDYSSATGDDMARALAEGKAAFALSSNVLIGQAWQYNPDANLSFIPVPALIGGPSYLIGGESSAFGAAKNGEHLAEAKEYLAFLAEPDSISALAAAAGNLPGLTNATAELGRLQPAFDAYVTSGEAELRPFFDRVYLPNGMWDTVVTTADGVVAGQSTPAAGTKQMESDFSTLFEQSK